MEEPKKKTRSFRVSDSLWAMIEQTAQEQGKKPSEIIIAALASHVGDVIRRDKSLTNQQVTSIMSKVDRLEGELSKVKTMLGKHHDEPTNSNTS
tara:strand:+ start:406 stop:687 length:282 start_codon:yes stop_codon:yes gene_type:complete